jgi:hypothetical protein
MSEYEYQDVDTQQIQIISVEEEVKVEEVVEEKPKKAKKPAKKFADVNTGDTYLSLAVAYRKEGVNATEYAKELRDKNKNKSLRTGVIIEL